MRPITDNSPEAWVRAVARMILRLALYAFLLVAIVYFVGKTRAIITAIIVATILAYIVRPLAGKLLDFPWFVRPHNAVAGAIRGLSVIIVRLMRREPIGRVERVRLTLHARRIIATLYVVVLLFVAGYYGVRVLLNPFVTEARNLVTNFESHRANLEQRLEDWRKWYEDKVPEPTRRWVDQQIKEGGASLDVQEKVSGWAQNAVRSLTGMVRNLVEVVLLPVLAFYFALESKKLKHEFVGMLPRRRVKEVLRMIHLFNLIMYSYVVGQAILCLIAGVVVGVGLQLLKMEYALTLGVLAGVTRAIPIIGPILGGIPIVLLALVTKGFGVALWVLIFFSILHFVESKFIMPMLIGDRMELHPVVIIVVLLIGGEFGGLLGMFFAPPLAAIIRVMVQRYWIPRTGNRTLPPPRQIDRQPA